MASLYSIVEGDLVPDLVAYDAYQQLMRRPSDGSEDVTLVQIVEAAEAEFNSYVGGMFTAAANIATAKPQVLFVTIYRLHARRAANADYQVPQQAKDDHAAAIKWAEALGRKLLASEGSVDPVGAPEIEWTAPRATHTMSQLDNL